VSCLQHSITLSVFDGQNQVAVRGFVGYHNGSLHGTIITTTGSVRQNVATLAMLDTNDARRGYLAGRHFFFYEATPQKRRLTDTFLIERFHEIAQECTTRHDADAVWQYAIAGMLGELSEQVFPAGQEEHAYWEAQEQAVLAEMAQQ
jgi:hypothetical protein